MSFSFGFQGDDIEEDPADAPAEHAGASVNMEGHDGLPPPVAAKSHSLDELLSTLPDRLSFSTLPITSPAGHTTRLPRRELFDTRLQLAAEDDLSSTSSHSTSNPSQSKTSTSPSTGKKSVHFVDQITDLTPNIYEGGYKTWECSIDLVRFLLDRGPRKDLDDITRVDHVIEMGAGTALPSLLLFQYALKNGIGLYFTLTDYNAEVLRLVSVPNLLLAYASTLPEHAQDFEQESGDLEVTPALLSDFQRTLRELGVTITLISGSWLPTSNLLPLIPSTEDLNTFILASETIYSPASLVAFAEAMVSLMSRVKSGKAVVAAKRVYFGVGGSIDEFKIECSRRGCVAYEIDFEGLGGEGDNSGGGVRRCLVEVQMY